MRIRLRDKRLKGLGLSSFGVSSQNGGLLPCMTSKQVLIHLSSAFVLGAIALSGRFSVNATKLLLVVAWAISAIGLHNQPLPIAIGTSAAIGVGLALLAYRSILETAFLSNQRR